MALSADIAAIVAAILAVVALVMLRTVRTGEADSEANASHDHYAELEPARGDVLVG